MKLLPLVTQGFDSAKSTFRLKNYQQKLSSCRLINHQRNCFHGWRIDSKPQTAPGPHKSSTKLLPWVRHGFDSAKSTCGLRNYQRKLSHCRLRNHQQNCFYRWHMDSTAQTAPMASEIINEIAPMGDLWIWKHKQPLRTQKSSTKYFHGWGLDSRAQTAPRDSEIINETASTGDAWIRQRKQHLRTLKSSTKLLPRVTHVFDSAKSPFGIKKTSTKTESLPSKKSTKLLPLVTHGFDIANIP
jgi:hypothetical protein